MEHRGVAVTCITRGDGGDNAVGNKDGWREVTWTEADGEQVGVVTLHVCVVAENAAAGFVQ